MCKSYTNSKSQEIIGKTCKIKTKPGEVLLFVKSGTDIENWVLKAEEPLPNEIVRYHASGKTRLGIPRMF